MGWGIYPYPRTKPTLRTQARGSARKSPLAHSFFWCDLMLEQCYEHGPLCYEPLHVDPQGVGHADEHSCPCRVFASGYAGYRGH